MSFFKEGGLQKKTQQLFGRRPYSNHKRFEAIEPLSILVLEERADVLSVLSRFQA